MHCAHGEPVTRPPPETDTIRVPHNRICGWARRRGQRCRRTQVYLASGVDPEQSRIFVQSHVKAHSELCWLLNPQTPMNWLERMIQ